MSLCYQFVIPERIQPHFIIRPAPSLDKTERNSRIKTRTVEVTQPINERVIDSLIPQMTSVFSQSCVSAFMSFSFKRLLAALSVNPHRECLCSTVYACKCVHVRTRVGVCVCDTEKVGFGHPTFQQPLMFELRPDALRC